MKDRGSVVLASNTLNTEAPVVAVAAMAVTVEVLKQVAVEVLAVVAMALTVVIMTQVVKAAQVEAAATAAKAETVAIPIIQAAVLVVAAATA